MHVALFLQADSTMFIAVISMAVHSKNRCAKNNPVCVVLNTSVCLDKDNTVCVASV